MRTRGQNAIADEISTLKGEGHLKETVERQGEPLTPEQTATRDLAQDAQISPDGQWIAYTLAPASLDATKDVEHGVSAIWVVPTEDGEPKQFTSGQWDDRSPRWSPDGQQLAFLSDRAERGKRSVYVMPTSGGEALRVFDQQGSVRELSWSPDGRSLAVLFTDPETEEEKKAKEAKDDVNVWDADPKWQRIWLIDLEAREAKAISPDGRQIWSYAWSPDGQQIAAVVSCSPRLNDIFHPNDLVVFPTAGGEPRQVATLPHGPGDLTWSSDGQRLAFRLGAGKSAVGEHIFSVAIAGGEPVDLTPGLQGTVEGMSALRKGEELALSIACGVDSTIQLLSWDGELRPASNQPPKGYFSSTPTFSSDGSRAAAVYEDASTAPQVISIDLNSGEAKTRTQIATDLEQADRGCYELVRWESDPGVEVEGLLYKPTGYQEGQRYPLVVQVHGGPTWYWANRFYASWHDWAQLLAGRGYAVLLPNPRGSTGRGTSYVNALFNEIGRGEFRDMMAGVDAMIERGIADPERLGIGGWSWGGYMTAWTVTQTQRFKAAVMGAGVSNMISDNNTGDIPGANLSYFDQGPYADPDPYYEHSAIRYLKQCQTPLLILHGEADTRVNMYQSVEMYVGLRELGREVQLVTYPRESHGISERKHQIDLTERVIAWFDQHLRDI